MTLLQLHINYNNISTYYKTGWKNPHITFTTRRAICPQVSINNSLIPIKQEMKYLGLHLDKKLIWLTHTKAKRRHLELKMRNMSWLVDRNSQLYLENKITIY
jgi:hypothetical protein